MNTDDRKERDFRDFMKTMSHGNPYDDEYSRIAERDAFCGAYGQRKHKGEKRNQARYPQPHAAKLGGYYSDYEGPIPPCLV